MDMSVILRCIFYLAVLVMLSIPFGIYIGKVMNGERILLQKVFGPVERFIYKILKINKDEEMNWKKYALSAVIFNAIGLVFLMALLMLQKLLPGNTQGIDGMSWHLAFNTAASFVTNTNWQAYSGETALSYLSQSLGLTVQNFVSAATGIAVLFALIRAFVKVKDKGLGSFWADMVRIILYILIPLNFVLALGLVSQGVVQNLRAGQEVSLIEPAVFDSDGNYIENAVVNGDTITVDGKEIKNAQIVKKAFVPMGPCASQVAIKQTGTNGGGYMGNNSAHPLENPTPFSNMLEMLSLLLIPAALCFTFGRNIKSMKQGTAIFMAMFIMLAAALGVVAYNEANAAGTQFIVNSDVNMSAENQAGGNMEGKEARFGIAESSIWATWTTAASNGSVNSMHDSYTPLGGLVPMLLMMLGEVVFGGVGCGLYGMIGFVILTVFIAGLMVGRTPEYLGKKIEPYEMKWAVLVCLATPIGILVGSALACALPQTADSLNNLRAHGLSEVLYAYSSAGGNNGSAFAGFNANTPFLNVSIGLVMIFVRFLPMLATLAISGSLVQKKRLAQTSGTLSTCNAMFVFLLIFIVLLIGALSFFPALALGPVAEYLGVI